MNRDKASIDDILRNSKQKFVNGVTFENFQTDSMLYLATERCLEIMGEATKRLSDEVRNQYPEIPWKKIAGLRDVIAHGYNFIDKREVWDICNNSIPSLIYRLEEILDSLE
ncbi:MAG: DUF86 domain-containing protein [Leptospiraceae bacterium]|nr:DUF86 domain-containing protein [Leptospiraceae bacterium]